MTPSPTEPTEPTEPTDSTPLPARPLAPLGTATREPTAVDAVAERWFRRTLELDPAEAAVHGLAEEVVPGRETEYRDYGPEGRQARAEAARAALAELGRTAPADDVDRVTAHALRERLGP